MIWYLYSLPVVQFSSEKKYIHGISKRNTHQANQLCKRVDLNCCIFYSKIGGTLQKQNILPFQFLQFCCGQLKFICILEKVRKVNQKVYFIVLINQWYSKIGFYDVVCIYTTYTGSWDMRMVFIFTEYSEVWSHK